MFKQKPFVTINNMWVITTTFGDDYEITYTILN